jgi:hypothetical protein
MPLSLPAGANSTPHHHLPLGRTCSTLLFSNFVEEKNIKGDKRNIVFLLV